MHGTLPRAGCVDAMRARGSAPARPAPAYPPAWAGPQGPCRAAPTLHGAAREHRHPETARHLVPSACREMAAKPPADMPRGQPLLRRQGQQEGRDGGDDAEAQRARERVPRLGHRLGRRFQRRMRHPCLREHFEAERRGERPLGGAALGQGRAQLPLQHQDAGRKRGLRDSAGLGRAAGMPVPGERRKMAKLLGGSQGHPRASSVPPGRLGQARPAGHWPPRACHDATMDRAWLKQFASEMAG